MRQEWARWHGGHVYTIQPVREPHHKQCGFRWVGFCDKDRCGFFRSKGDFEAFIRRQPSIIGPLGPHAQATFEAEAHSTYAGMKALELLHERCGLGRK
jgi:hypothetical protein